MSKEDKAPGAKAASAKKAKRVYHITKNPETKKWQVFLEGGERAIAVFDTQKEALARAKELSKNNDRGYQIHKASGQIRKKDYSKKK